MKTTLFSLAFALISILSFGQGLTISGSVGFTSCSTANISITVNNLGTGPYRYKLAENILINSPLEAINSAASTITFSYACQPGTTYYAEVRDATDEVRVLTFQIPSSNPLNFVFPGTNSCNPDATLNVVRLRCDSIQIRGLSFSPSFNGGFTNGFPNYQVQLIDLSANGSVIGNTFTYSHKGKQYIGIISGVGGLAAAETFAVQSPLDAISLFGGWGPLHEVSLRNAKPGAGAINIFSL